MSTRRRIRCFTHCRLAIRITAIEFGFFCCCPACFQDREHTRAIVHHTIAVIVSERCGEIGFGGGFPNCFQFRLLVFKIQVFKRLKNIRIINWQTNLLIRIGALTITNAQEECGLNAGFVTRFDVTFFFIKIQAFAQTIRVGLLCLATANTQS